MSNTKKKIRITSIIAMLAFAISIAIHLAFDITTGAIIVYEIIGKALALGHYVICILFIIFILLNKKQSILPAILLCLENICLILVFWNMVKTTYDFGDELSDISWYYYRFLNVYEGKYFIVMLLFSIVFLVDNFLIKKSGNIKKLYSYLTVVFCISVIGYSVYEIIADELKFGLVGVFIAVFYIGMLFISISYCEAIKIKHHLINLTGAEEKPSSYDSAESLKGYYDLLQQGIITEEEYEKKKDELIQ